MRGRVSVFEDSPISWRIRLASLVAFRDKLLVKTYYGNMNKINWKPKAVKQLMKVPKADQTSIRDEVGEQLTRFPMCQKVKQLTNHAYSYRLRVGRYRVFFEFDGSVKIVSI